MTTRTDGDRKSRGHRRFAASVRAVPVPPEEQHPRPGASRGRPATARMDGHGSASPLALDEVAARAQGAPAVLQPDDRCSLPSPGRPSVSFGIPPHRVVIGRPSTRSQGPLALGRRSSGGRKRLAVRGAIRTPRFSEPFASDRRPGAQRRVCPVVGPRRTHCAATLDRDYADTAASQFLRKSSRLGKINAFPLLLSA